MIYSYKIWKESLIHRHRCNLVLIRNDQHIYDGDTIIIK